MSYSNDLGAFGVVQYAPGATGTIVGPAQGYAPGGIFTQPKPVVKPAKPVASAPAPTPLKPPTFPGGTKPGPGQPGFPGYVPPIVVVKPVNPVLLPAPIVGTLPPIASPFPVRLDDGSNAAPGDKAYSGGGGGGGGGGGTVPGAKTVEAGLIGGLSNIFGDTPPLMVLLALIGVGLAFKPKGR